VNRRTFVGTLGIAFLAAPLAVEAQPAGKTFRLGLLATNRPTESPPGGPALSRWTGTPGSGETIVAALIELGYVEGRNIVIERRYSEGKPERLPGLAAELVGLRPDVLYAHGGGPGAAVHRATSTIPIVVVTGGDLVAEGLVASLRRPGGNVTGVQAMQPDTAGKRLALLKEVIPGLSVVGLLFATPPNMPGASQWREDTLREIQSVGRALNIAIHIASADKAAGVDAAFATLISERVAAVLIPSTTIAAAQRGHLAELARRSRMPTFGDDDSYAKAGFLMSYGPDYRELVRRAATYIDKILKGVRPVDLPVEQPTKFELVINLKTAKALGLTIPPSLLLRADEVIQ
jgi:putative ABC transport system substrate-binding protein